MKSNSKKLKEHFDAKPQSGITLIALVITIIVLLILAGVSINLVLGENGVLAKAKYASFVNEMTAVEEKLNIWKTGEVIDVNYTKPQTKIPTAGLYGVSELEKTTRLAGEVGYYRVWDINETKPDMDINSSASIFNNAFESELIYYPAGVQDLYYLDNDELGITGSKKYLIDASNGMVYSTVGTNINGIQCYSLNMAKMAMGGYNEKPAFAAAEVSGSAGNLAGNVSSKYLVDENGNYILDENGNKIENPDYNPYGFEIISNLYSENLYKLYNNGDLYGKGLKGITLNTSESEMDKINEYKWNTFTVPKTIPGYDTREYEIYPGYKTVYVIDKNNDLWAWGDNSNNKLGLTQEQQIEYTGREPVKLNVDGKKVKNVYTGSGNFTFVITNDDKLYAAGYNLKYNFGLGYSSTEVTSFVQLNVDNVEHIKKILAWTEATLIWYDDNTFLYTGNNRHGELGTGNTTEVFETFTRIWDGNIGPDYDQDIKDVSIGGSCMLLFNSGKIMQSGYTGQDSYGNGGGSLISGNSKLFREFNGEFGTGVTNIYIGLSWRIIQRVNSQGEVEVWGSPGRDNELGLDSSTYNTTNFYKINLPEELKVSGIKEIFTTRTNVYYLGNNGKIYGSGRAMYSGLNRKQGTIEEVSYFGIENIQTLYSTNNVKIKGTSDVSSTPLCFTGNDGNIYTTSNGSVVFGDQILQKSWVKVASNVKSMDFNDTYCIAYVSKDKELYIAGNDLSILGVGNNSIDKCNQIIKHPDTSIQGKVEKVWVNATNIYILTTDGKLMGTGKFSDNGGSCYPGWTDEEDKNTFVEILDNVKFFTTDISNDSRIAIKNSGEAYGWGRNMGNMTGQTKTRQNLPQQYTLPAEIGGVDNIAELYTYDYYRSYILTKDGKFFMVGSHRNNTWDGGETTQSVWTQYTHNINLNESEKIISVACMNNRNLLLSTNQGRVFGWGEECYLGTGNTTTNTIETNIIQGLSNVSQIVAGHYWYVAITEDGKVYGTGKNQYGILGRWIGVDRKTPNSRYKTAFDWVECPELEI